MKIVLTQEEVGFLVEMCNREIAENEILIMSEPKPKTKAVWREENNFVRGIRDKIEAKKEKLQFILNGLSAEQEEFIIESGLEQMREARER